MRSFEFKDSVNPEERKIVGISIRQKSVLKSKGLPGVVNTPHSVNWKRKDCGSERVQVNGYPVPPISNRCVT